MSIKKIITGLILLLLLASGVASADGNELLADCQLVVNHMDSGKSAQNDQLQMGQCIGLSNGVRTTMSMFNRELTDDSILRACFPEDGINNGQAVRIITSYLQKNPAKLHMHESILAIMAFIDAYPCK